METTERAVQYCCRCGHFIRTAHNAETARWCEEEQQPKTLQQTVDDELWAVIDRLGGPNRSGRAAVREAMACSEWTQSY